MTFYPHSFFVSCCFLWKQFCCDLLSFQHPPAPAILPPTSISFSFSSTRCLLLKLYRKLHLKRSTEYFTQSDIIDLLCFFSPSFLIAKIDRKMTAISITTYNVHGYQTTTLIIQTRVLSSLKLSDLGFN